MVKTTPAYFRTKYSVPGGVTVLGPYGGNLSNAGEKLELVKPTDTDESGQTVYARVDRVVYSDGSHPAGLSRRRGFMAYTGGWWRQIAQQEGPDGLWQ